jgi:hypothetical protein
MRSSFQPSFRMLAYLVELSAASPSHGDGKSAPPLVLQNEEHLRCKQTRRPVLSAWHDDELCCASIVWHLANQRTHSFASHVSSGRLLSRCRVCRCHVSGRCEPRYRPTQGTASPGTLSPQGSWVSWQSSTLPLILLGQDASQKHRCKIAWRTTYSAISDLNNIRVILFTSGERVLWDAWCFRHLDDRHVSW